MIYQTNDGRSNEVRGRFSLAAKGEVRFKVDSYDHKRKLVIDPTLAYSPYFGYGPGVTGIAVDSGGEACVTGSANNTLPSTPGAYQYIKPGNTNVAYVSCLNAAGTQLAYSTYLGGTGGDFATGIAVDAAGNLYVGGYTNSIDFPMGSTTLISKKPSTNLNYSAFVAKVGSRGTALVWSSYLGGTGSDKISAVAVDTSGQLFVTGTTISKDFPTKNAPEATYKQIFNTGFASAFNASGSSLLYSTYLSGSNRDSPNAIAVDASSNAYIAGNTSSVDFPTTGGAVQKTKLAPYDAAFVTKIPVTGNSFTYSTFLSGTSQSAAYAITVDSTGEVIVGGSTHDADFPVSPTAYQKTNITFNNDQSTGFVAKLNPAGSKLLYATYLGGETSGDQVSAIAADVTGKAYITGTTYSTKFPVTPDALYSSKRSSALDISFITILSADGSSAAYSTYFGGSSQDQPNSIFLDNAGAIYIAGYTSSADYPVTPGTYEYTSIPPASGGTSSSFITKFGSMAPAAAAPTFTPPGGPYTSSQSVTIADATYNSTIYYTTDNSTPTRSSKTYTGAIAVSTTTTINAIAVASGFSNSSVTTATYTITAAPVAATPVISPASTTFTSTQTVTITDATSVATVYYTTNGNAPLTSSTKYTGPFTVSATTTVNAISVATGYTNSAVASATYTLGQVQVAPTASLALSPSTITMAQALTVTVTVAGSAGKIPTGAITLTSFNYASASVSLSTGTASIVIPAGALSTGVLTITATYTPDTASSSSSTSGSGTATVMVTTAVTPGFTVSGTAVTVKAGATQGNTSTITVTPSNGFTGNVTITAAVTSGPTGASNVPTVSFGSTSPVNITGTSARSATLSISTTAPKTSSLSMPQGFGTSSKVALAGIPFVGSLLLLFIPRRKSHLWRLGALLFAMGLAFGITGCGGSGGGGSTTTTTTPGTTTGAYTVTITATSGSTITMGTVTVTVQ